MTERGYKRDPYQWSGEREPRLEIQSRITKRTGKIIRWQGSKQTEDNALPHSAAES